MTDLELKIIARLRELQNGAEPLDRNCGICRDVAFHFGQRAVDILKDKFVAMGLNRIWPIGEDTYYGFFWSDLWSGPRGVKRREFAGRVADFMEGKK